MNVKYEPKKIEPKWQQYWEEKELFHAKTGSKKKKFYGLVEFPYPSGDGLHTGHVRGYTAMDVIARKRRHEGFEVLYPIGWDAFGLPTENFAIKHGIHPREVTKKNTDNFRRQMQSLGFSFDWSREINTTDPGYYKWTQWIFLQLFKKGLAYKQKMEINWCPSCKIGLANEEAQGGVCERCGGPTEKKEKEQWMLAITKYADRLDKDLDDVEYLEKIKVQQRNWIGRSEGALVKFKLQKSKSKNETKWAGVGFLIQDSAGKFLFQKRDLKTLRDAGMITLFGGGRHDENESPEECVKREYREELGISLAADQITSLGDFPSKNTPGEIIKVFFVSHVSKKDLKLQEGEKIVSSTIEDALIDKNVTDFTKEILRFYQEQQDQYIEVFTTRVDTIFGCTYVVVAPEHHIIAHLLQCHSREGGNPDSANILDPRVKPEDDSLLLVENAEKIREYIEEVKKKSEEDRLDATKEKTGVKLEGIEAVNPFTGESVPVFVADYVLGNYGTGAVMAVPAHDERDWEFAKKYELPVKQVVAPFFLGSEGKDAVRLDRPTVRRKTAFSFVKHWSDEKYICLDWEKFGWHSGIIGGVEEGECYIEAAMREIVEETGYKHPKFVKYVGGEMHTNFYAAHKDVNRYAEGVGMLFQLEDDAWEKPDEKEILHHKAVWVDRNDMEIFLNLRNFQYMWKRLNFGEDSFGDDGILIDSGEFSGLKSEEAREKMTAWLEKEGLGKKQTNYKLRDWVFSRQRYWGEPIPLVRCEACCITGAQTKLSINFYSEAIWSRLLSGKKTIETRALNPEESERYFGNVVSGDLLKFVYKKTGEEKLFRVKNVFRFANLKELFNRKDLHEKILSKKYTSVGALTKAYEALAHRYAEKIEKNGLVGWEIELVNVGKWVPLPESELPLKLPRVQSYTPTDTGESPLSAMEEWVATKCPKCGGPARRETDTMPNWAGSSWYFLRYADPKNTEALASKSALEYWMPVDWYNGGMEHTTLHLLYSRFWHKFLYDIGVVPTSEPYQKRTSHGLILAEGGVKMSKSKGNVVNPDDIVRRFGADTLRVYEMFMGPFDQNVAWSTESIAGSRRFLEKVWKLGIGIQNQETGIKKEDAHAGNVSVKTLLHKTIKKVSEDIEAMRFNTAISALMILVNEMEKVESMSREDFEALLVLLSPFAPHVAEELWSLVGNAGSILSTKWPEANPKYLVADEVEVVVQVNGKLRARLRIASGSLQDEVESAARADLLVAKHLEGKEIRKTVFVQDRLVNFVV